MNITDYASSYPKLSNVTRFNMEKIIHKQTIGEHGYSVCNLFFLICMELGLTVDPSMLMVVLNHDYVEIYTGDLNKKIKEKSGATHTAWNILENEAVPEENSFLTDTRIEKYLTSKGYVYLTAFQLADSLEALLYCTMEMKMGNAFLKGPHDYYRNKSTMLTDTLRELTGVQLQVDKPFIWDGRDLYEGVLQS